jgi:hypothetical protein
MFHPGFIMMTFKIQQLLICYFHRRVRLPGVWYGYGRMENGRAAKAQRRARLRA